MGWAWHERVGSCSWHSTWLWCAALAAAVSNPSVAAAQQLRNGGSTLHITLVAASSAWYGLCLVPCTSHMLQSSSDCAVFCLWLPGLRGSCLQHLDLGHLLLYYGAASCLRGSMLCIAYALVTAWWGSHKLTNILFVSGSASVLTGQKGGQLLTVSCMQGLWCNSSCSCTCSSGAC